MSSEITKSQNRQYDINKLILAQLSILYNSLLSGVVGGGGYLTYQIPAEEIDGTQDTFVVPFTIDKTKSPLVINDTFTYSLIEGIESITNADGHATIVLTNPILEGNIAYVLYSVPGTTTVTVTGSKELTDDHTIDLTDIEQDLYCNFATDKTITLPQDSDVAIPVNTRINVRMGGVGSVIFAEGTGATMNSVDSADRITSQYGWATLVKSGDDTWDLIGVITAA